MADVFISHSSKDHDIAEHICDELEKKGLKCWFAPRDIKPGEEWAKAINTAITSSSAFIIIYSANSSQSTQVPREIGLAGAKNLYIIPYKIDDTKLSDEFEYYLLGSHWIIADIAKKDYKIDELNNVILSAKAKKIAASANLEEQSAQNGQTVNNFNVTEIKDSNVTYTSPAIKNKLPIIISAAAAFVVILCTIIIVAVSGSKPQVSDENSQTTTTVSEPEVTTTTTVAVTTTTTTTTTVSAKEVPAIGQASSGTETLEISLELLGYSFKGTYTGDVVNGAPMGKGDFVGTGEEEEGVIKSEYSGTWVEGKANGEGLVTFTRENGDVSTWTGKWFDGQLNGQGVWKRVYANGIITSYEGSFSEGVRSGHGKSSAFYVDGVSEIKEGVWEGNNSLTGNGTKTINYSDGAVRVIEGAWVNGEIPVGKRTLTYTDGDYNIYEGEINFDGFGNGQGKKSLYRADGTLYRTDEGVFANDALNGLGKRYDLYDDGGYIMYEGEFVDGQYNGQGKLDYYSADGTLRHTDEGTFADGSFVG